MTRVIEYVGMSNTLISGTIDRVLEDIMLRCRELKLRLANSEEKTLQEFTVLLTVQVMNYLHSGRHRIAL